jgi:hypothetical protein
LIGPSRSRSSGWEKRPFINRLEPILDPPVKPEDDEKKMISTKHWNNCSIDQDLCNLRTEKFCRGSWLAQTCPAL